MKVVQNFTSYKTCFGVQSGFQVEKDELTKQFEFQIPNWGNSNFDLGQIRISKITFVFP